MAFRDNKLSTKYITAPFLGSRNKKVTKVLDYEDGGIANNDPSMGLFYQTWTARITSDKTEIKVSAPTVAEFTAVTGVEITEVSITFDQNARLTIVYVENTECKLYWYDSEIENFTTTNFGSTYLTPKISLDDKRELQGGNSDIIFAYVRSSNLYFRRQRDRFTIEYLLKSGVPATLEKIGMNTRLRFQFQFLSDT